MQCLFSGEETNTDEHVIPAWLQRRMSLSHQKVIIPNGTTLQYRHLKVPAAKEHNHKFGEIENRISQGIFNLQEVYLWALKIHIGFIYRDSRLKIDIKDPKSPFMLNIGDFQSEVHLFQLLYKNWLEGGSTDPSPFGSVYIVDSLSPINEFDFFHCLITGTIGIDIGDKFILVFLWDQGDSLQTNILEQWEKFHVPRVKFMENDAAYKDHCYMAHHVWACESAYWIYRQRRSFNFLLTDKNLMLIPPITRLKGKDIEPNELRQIARNFGIELVKFNGEFGNMYSPFRPQNT